METRNKVKKIVLSVASPLVSIAAFAPIVVSCEKNDSEDNDSVVLTSENSSVLQLKRVLHKEIIKADIKMLNFKIDEASIRIIQESMPKIMKLFENDKATAQELKTSIIAFKQTIKQATESHNKFLLAWDELYNAISILQGKMALIDPAQEDLYSEAVRVVNQTQETFKNMPTIQSLQKQTAIVKKFIGKIN
ncbi:hypothetical protein [Metamycoplasma neophronis]|uniref:Lipoprotein n=1 Tax=Metamycoplasma neophronis TaxID=872983 RepID=A0ABY2Z0B7_9BACT|nr:hypothetical protein [Metamycoplasma neophronis]TPR54323.1 hypothetical protein FJR74_00905 [Metamycoplasma neophronis]